jgi:hypothetical protein
VVLSEGQRLLDTYYIKKGTVQLLESMGTKEEKVTASLGQYDNFGLDLHRASGGDESWESSTFSIQETYQYAIDGARTRRQLQPSFTSPLPFELP